MVEGPGADSEEKHEPVSDIDTAAADSLKVLDLKRPIREADIRLDSRRRQQKELLMNMSKEEFKTYLPRANKKLRADPEIMRLARKYNASP